MEYVFERKYSLRDGNMKSPSELVESCHFQELPSCEGTTSLECLLFCRYGACFRVHIHEDFAITCHEFQGPEGMEGHMQFYQYDESEVGMAVQYYASISGEIVAEQCLREKISKRLWSVSHDSEAIVGMNLISLGLRFPSLLITTLSGTCYLIADGQTALTFRLPQAASWARCVTLKTQNSKARSVYIGCSFCSEIFVFNDLHEPLHRALAPHALWDEMMKNEIVRSHLHNSEQRKRVQRILVEKLSEQGLSLEKRKDISDSISPSNLVRLLLLYPETKNWPIENP